MNTINHIFELLDDWRHLPDYQLERRADIFFAVYLPEFLAHWLRLHAPPCLIPELPLRLGRLDDTRSNLSCKVDYLAVAPSDRRAFLVELKTEARSAGGRQRVRMEAATRFTLGELVRDVQQIARASRHKSKYERLAEKLDAVGLNADATGDLLDVKPAVLYVVPNPSQCPALTGLDDQRCVAFDALAEWLESRAGDAVGSRFAQSLRRWSGMKAGERSTTRASGLRSGSCAPR